MSSSELVKTATVDTYNDPSVGNKSIGLFEESNIFISIEQSLRWDIRFLDKLVICNWRRVERFKGFFELTNLKLTLSLPLLRELEWNWILVED